VRFLLQSADVSEKYRSKRAHLGQSVINSTEVAMGMLMEATVPRSHRWIPQAMTVQYGVIWTIA
jgi:hypothetical protein